MMFRKKNHKGFTLIELLVVVGIISLLSSVVLVSLNGARIKARNVKRLSEAKQLVNALALALNDTSSLPTTSDWACVSVTCYGLWSGYTANAGVDAMLAPYIKKAIDPSDGGARQRGGYVYNNPWAGPSGTGAYIDWTLEPGGTCGFATTYSVDVNYTTCVYKVD